jgi:hypothetical protein
MSPKKSSELLSKMSSGLSSGVVIWENIIHGLWRVRSTDAVRLRICLNWLAPMKMLKKIAPNPECEGPPLCLRHRGKSMLKLAPVPRINFSSRSPPLSTVSSS